MATDLYGISADGDTLIINEETGGQAYYNATERHPDWPGGASGVTIGIGYDCGYSTTQDIANDWGPNLPANAVEALKTVIGITGSPASSHAHELHWIDVSWDAAIAVYHGRDLPKWVNRCTADLPNFDALNGDCKGALVSLAFNRGQSWNIPAAQDPNGRYVEMRNIKAHMANRAFDQIPGEFLAMRRLWPVGKDLYKRRTHEAALFQKGLDAIAAGT